MKVGAGILLIRALAIAALLTGITTHAHAGAQELADAALSALDLVVERINQGVDTFATAAPFLDLGKKIAGTLFVLVFTWGIIRSWVLGKGLAQLTGDLVQPLILLGLVLFALDNKLGVTIKDSVLSLADMLAASIGITNTANIETQLLAGLVKTGFNIMDTKLSASTGASSGTGILDWFKDLPGNMMGATLAFILGWIARLVAGVAMIGAGAVAVGIVLVAKLSIGLALVFAPVLIPWGMWRPTEFLLTSWVRYLVSAAMQAVVAVAVGGLLMSVVNSLVAQVGEINSHEASIALSVAFIAFGLLSIYLMLQVPRLASGLISGDGTLGLDRWTVGAAAMAGSTAAIATAPARAVAGAVGKGIGGAAQGRGIVAGAAAARAASRTGAGVVGAAQAGMASYGATVNATRAALSALTPAGAVAAAAKAKGGAFPRAPKPTNNGGTP